MPQNDIVKMTPNELRLAAELLDMTAADEFGNHGCNDLNPALQNKLTSEEFVAMALEYGRYNKEDPAWKPDMRWIGDFSLMAFMEFMAFKLRNIADAEEQKSNDV